MMLIPKEVVILGLVSLAYGVKYEPNWNSLDSRPLPTWYDEAKVGIFIHWGVFSVPSFGDEWFWWYWKGIKNPAYVNFMKENYRPGFTYPDFAPQFRAEFFDPDHWADVFKAAGARYIVLTSKHHEGFTNWPSPVSWNWNSMDIGPKRDLVGDLANSIRNRTDIKFGLYHSLFEWFNPLWKADLASKYKTQDFVEKKTMPELHKLVNRYKPYVIWSDGDWGAPPSYWNSTGFLAWLYNDSPVKDYVVTNDRWGRGTMCKHGGYYTCHDRYDPGKLQNHKWEDAMTIDKGSWGYRRNVNLNDYLSSLELITTLVKTVSCGGNLLVNVGPTHDGRILPIFEERLRQMGDWLKVNGEAIYGSKPWRYQQDNVTKTVWYTQSSSGRFVYGIVLAWPENQEVHFSNVKTGPKSSVTMLGYQGRSFPFSRAATGTKVKLTGVAPNKLPSGIAWVFRFKNAQAAFDERKSEGNPPPPNAIKSDFETEFEAHVNDLL